MRDWSSILFVQLWVMQSSPRSSIGSGNAPCIHCNPHSKLCEQAATALDEFMKYNHNTLNCWRLTQLDWFWRRQARGCCSVLLWNNTLRMAEKSSRGGWLLVPSFVVLVLLFSNNRQLRLGQEFGLLGRMLLLPLLQEKTASI